MGPKFNLKSPRRVPDSSQSVHCAMDGNIEKLKNLFRRDLASPWDVSSTCGYTLSPWALYSKQYATVRFLTSAGADADYRPIARTDNSTRNKAFGFVLQGRLGKEAEEALRCLTATGDWIEGQNFSKLHKIILGLLGADLEEEIAENPELIYAVDAMGRTALTWAAARGDHKSVQILLDHGADPDILDMYASSPIAYAADRSRTLCVKLLLEAGCKADTTLPPIEIMGGPLNCAARNANDPIILGCLLTYGAFVDNTGGDGVTPLMHAAQTDNVGFAIILVNYNANINITSITDQISLTTAITYNSHGVLELLLDRWIEFSTCPRLKGPHLIGLRYSNLYKDINI
ncbi:hypothetical protein EAF04_005203 [Stromatinia cepivora]|nr:hypothetical protein EAF04_005203 [Stromatinia cepivora]